MKKLTALLLTLLLTGSMSITAFAKEAVITTRVPDCHNIIVTADGAEVFCDGQPGSEFTVDRLSEPTLLIRASSGRKITRILLNGEDITDQRKGGYYTLKPVYEDQILTVVTTEAVTGGQDEQESTDDSRDGTDETDEAATPSSVANPSGPERLVSPRTGDVSPAGLWLALMILSCGGMLTILFNTRKKKRIN